MPDGHYSRESIGRILAAASRGHSAATSGASIEGNPKAARSDWCLVMAGRDG
jgi:hypothetical protein